MYTDHIHEWFDSPLYGMGHEGVDKLFKIGKQPINSRIEAYYNIEKPDNGPDWQTVFMFQFLSPK